VSKRRLLLFNGSAFHLTFMIDAAVAVGAIFGANISHFEYIIIDRSPSLIAQ